MKTVTVYTPTELKEANPGAYDKALEHWQQSQEDWPWGSEIVDSLKAVFEHSGIALRDYSIDGTSPSLSSVKFDIRTDVAGLTGQRALAWLENNLFDGLRMGWGLANIRRRMPYTKAGHIPVCPFTGVCFDEDMLDALRKGISSGDTIEEAYQGLAYEAGRLMEAELEGATSEDAFLDNPGEYHYTESGHLVR